MLMKVGKCTIGKKAMLCEGYGTAYQRKLSRFFKSNKSKSFSQYILGFHYTGGIK
jgi:hypothetical protein